MIAYTTAPQAYDGFSTRTVQPVVGYDGSKPVRKIELDERDWEWQCGRNGSGMHATYTEAEFAQLQTRPWFRAATQVDA